MKELNKYDLNRIIQFIPKNLAEIMRTPTWYNKIFIGGGFIRAIIAGEKINDVDLFVTDKDSAKFLSLLLKEDKQVYETENAYTIKFRTPIQIIHRWTFEKPSDVVNSFDFTICSAVLWYGKNTEDVITWSSLCDDTFYEDLSAKRLVYKSPEREEAPGGSMIRILKYYQRGYKIPLHNLAKVMARICQGLKWDVVKDSNYSEFILTEGFKNLLYEVDPQIVNTNIDE